MRTYAELKEAWAFTGIDVDKMVSDIEELVTRYNHSNSKYGICKFLEEFITNKADLIRTIMKNPNYNGNLQIVFEEPYNRPIDRVGVRNTVTNITSCENTIYLRERKDGKTRDDVIKESIKDMPRFINVSNILDSMNKFSCDLSEFTYEGYTRESVEKGHKFRRIMNMFREYSCENIDEDMANAVKGIDSEIKGINNGMKTSRAFNKVCTFYNIINLPLYKREFAKYGDSINTMGRNLIHVISLNPLDYLTMSFGNTWASCHTIDKQNRRHMPDNYSGMYCGGTLSYALDKVSFIQYTIGLSSDREHPEKADKIYRNMCHYSNGYLVQGRVYPQSNDGALDLYKHMRSVFQRELCVCLEVENKWLKKGKAYDYRREGIFRSEGVHYPDYERYNDPVLSELKNFTHDRDAFTIGHYGVDLNRGTERSIQGELATSATPTTTETTSYFN